MKLYKDFEPNIKSGDLIAWYPSSIFGKIVSLFTSSEYSHTAIAFWSGDELFIIEAIFPEVRLFPLKETKPFHHIPMNIDWKGEYNDYLISLLGQKYSVLEAIKAYLSSPDKNNKWECAEFCNNFYLKAGLNFGNSNTPSKIVKAALEYTNGSLTVIS